MIVSHHQSNYQTLRSLRATSAALDERIRSTLLLLADTRKTLQNTPVTLPPTDTRRVEADELLNHAQRIARFSAPTRPAVFAEDHEHENEHIDGVKRMKLEETDSRQASTPAASRGSTPRIQKQNIGIEKESRAIAALPPHLRAWLLPTPEQVPYVPWPTEDVLRFGALAKIQGAKDRGVEIEDVDLAEEVREEANEHEAGGLKKVESRARGPAASTNANMLRRVNTAGSEGQDAFDDFDLYDPENG